MKVTPSSLYVTSVRRVAENFENFSTLDLSRLLTESMRFDIYWDLFTISNDTDPGSYKTFYFHTPPEFSQLYRMSNNIWFKVCTFKL